MRLTLSLFALLCIALAPTLQAQTFRIATEEAGLAPEGAEDFNGVAVADYDMDGDLDIYMVAYRQYDPDLPLTWNRLFRNEGNGQFIDVTAEAGALSKVRGFDRGGMGNKFGASWGDYDNDGDPDLFLTNVGPEQLFRNEGNGTFTDVTEEAGLTHSDDGHTSSSVWWDYDLDGDLDLYIGVWAGTTSANRFYQNEGDGTFVDITESTGLGDEGRTWTSMPIDANRDGRIDLYVVNDFGPNKFYENQGNGSFREATAEYGLEDPGHGMGVTVGDYNNDGLFDIYLTNIAEYFPNPLFLNTGDASFENHAEAMGVQDAGWAWGTEFFDCDHDGDLDLYVANGYLIDRGSNHFFTNQLFGNNEPIFENRSVSSGADGFGESRGLTVFDYDDDGDLDLLVANWSEPPSLYANESPSLNWLKIDLEGTVSNRDAFGATVRISSQTNTVYRHNDGVEFLGQSIQPIHVGVGYATMIDEIAVTWPNGTVDFVYDVAANQTIKIVEGHGLSSTSIETPDTPADALTLYHPFPNPFHSSTTLTFNLPGPGDVEVTVYNVLGQEVLNKRVAFDVAGRQHVALDGTTFTQSGLFIYRVRWQDRVQSGVITRVR